MKKLLLIFLFLSSISAQVVLDEKFDDFTFNHYPGTVAHWVFHGKALGDTVDLSGNGHTLIREGGFGLDSLLDISITEMNGQTTYLNGLQGRLKEVSTAYNMAQYTFALIVKVTGNAGGYANVGLLRYENNWVLWYLGYLPSTYTLKFYQIGSTNWTTQWTSAPSNEMIVIVGKFDGTTAYLYSNGTLVASNNTGSGKNTGTGTLYIAGDQYNQYPTGFFNEAIIYNQAINDKKIKELGFIANGWYSKNGGVTRNNWGWEQGIVSDTIYAAIPNYTIPANRHAILSFDAYGASGGETLQAWLTGWNGHFSQTVSTQKTRYEVDLGALSFSSDSLYFAVPSGTVYIDNVKIEYKRQHISKNYHRW